MNAMVLMGRRGVLADKLLLKPAAVMVATVLVLGTDAIARSRVVEIWLGALGFALLLTLTQGMSTRDRHQVWGCVAVGTGVELFGSIFWGAYRYRLGGVPLYVPPGHGLVYLAGIYLGRSRLLNARPTTTVRVAVALAGGWALAGLTVFPLIGQRADVLGAFFFAYFAVFALRSGRGTFFAAIFLLTSFLEIIGTWLGVWTWAVHAPGIGIPMGNPPSVIAGAYCTIDAMVLVLIRVLSGRRSREIQPATLAPAA